MTNLHALFARPVHRTAFPHIGFECNSWRSLFKALRVSFKLLTSEIIVGDLMKSEYALIMNDVLIHLSKRNIICLTLDGSENVQGKQVINMMACKPKEFFLEHFTRKLQRESANNFLEKLLDCKLRLLRSIRKPAFGFALIKDPVHDANYSNVKVNLKAEKPYSRNEHFSNPLMFCFCSDSPSVMVKLRKDCLDKKSLCLLTASRLMRSTICA